MRTLLPLLVASLLSVPHQTWGTLAACLTTIGLGGMALVLRAVHNVHRQQTYRLVAVDWLWYTVLPPLGYATFAVAGSLLHVAPGAALQLVGAGMLLLLFVGIHNAWDAAVFLATGE